MNWLIIRSRFYQLRWQVTQCSRDSSEMLLATGACIAWRQNTAFICSPVENISTQKLGFLSFPTPTALSSRAPHIETWLLWCVKAYSKGYAYVKESLVSLWRVSVQSSLQSRCTHRPSYKRVAWQTERQTSGQINRRKCLSAQVKTGFKVTHAKKK